jgi:hypothetical protein
MACWSLLSHAPVSVQNIHAIPIEGSSPQQAANEYEAFLKRHYGADTIDPNPNRALSDLALAQEKEGRSHDLTVHRPVRSKSDFALWRTARRSRQLSHAPGPEM